MVVKIGKINYVNMDNIASFTGVPSENIEGIDGVDNYIGQSLVIESVIMSDNALTTGETSTLTIFFQEPAYNFDNTNITHPNGTLTPIDSFDGGVTWTCVFTPTEDIIDNTNVISVDTGMNNEDGNPPLVGKDSANYTIDTTV